MQSTQVIQPHTARELILQNREWQLAKQLNISTGYAYSVVHDNFQFHKVCTSWLPHELMDEHTCKHMCLHNCPYHLEHYCKGDNFLQQIDTSDETWVHHYQPQAKQKNIKSKHPSSPTAKKFKMQSSAGKSMLTILRASKGHILETYLERWITVTNVTYSNMLQRGLKPCLKRRGRLSECILLL
jgi:hypothetical protein